MCYEEIGVLTVTMLVLPPLLLPRLLNLVIIGTTRVDPSKKR